LVPLPTIEQFKPNSYQTVKSQEPKLLLPLILEVKYTNAVKTSKAQITHTSTYESHQYIFCLTIHI